LTDLTDEPLYDARLRSIVFAARDVHLYELVPADPAALDGRSAGAHIDVLLPTGVLRQYSLVRADGDDSSLWIGVKREAESRGGSSWLHDHARVGTTLKISAPRNHFALDETAPHSVLIAGGIGVTPIRAMVARLEALGRSWELHYAARSREDAALADELEALGGRVRFHFDEGDPARMLDLGALVAAGRAGAHFYCCGPKPMLAAFETATAALPAERVHLEYFAAKEDAAKDGGYTVELARSGKEFAIPPGQSILEVLEAAGIRVPHSCQEGVCGSCETGVLSGTPDHRDSVLSAGERERGDVMMICCSGCVGDRLVLDL
jgi:ferredoxin-NADP reductase